MSPSVTHVHGIRLQAGQCWGVGAWRFTLTGEVNAKGSWLFTEGGGGAFATGLTFLNTNDWRFISGPVDGVNGNVEGQDQARYFQAHYDARDTRVVKPACTVCSDSKLDNTYIGKPCPECVDCGPQDCLDDLTALNALCLPLPFSSLHNNVPALFSAMRSSVSGQREWPKCCVSGAALVPGTRITKGFHHQHTAPGEGRRQLFPAWTCPHCWPEGA